MDVAILDVDSGLVRALTNRLNNIGWRYRVLTSPPRVEQLINMRLNVLILDIDVLGPAAWEYLERVCAEMPTMGVIVCTLRSSVAQRVRGLRLGADDWVAKPCHPEELIARAEAAARRNKRATVPDQKPSLTAGEVEIRPGQFQAFVHGGSLELTRREFEVLHLLAEAGGQVLEREQIYERIWGYTMARGDRSVDVFVRKIRQKIEKAAPGREFIHTHFGIGYRFGQHEPGERHSAAPQGQTEDTDSDPETAQPRPAVLA